MCFASGGGSDEADRARRDEGRRQDRIKVGTKNINSIFDGGTFNKLVAPTNEALDFGSGEYYGADGKRLTGALEKFDNEAVFGAPEQRVGQFDDAFFRGRRDAFTAYATPQLEDQYTDAQKELAFSLDRSGLTDSSARGQQVGKLQKLYDTNKRNVADQALSYETQARTGVEDARAGLVATLNATGDAEGAATSALARAQALSAPPAYSPLGQLFTDFTGGLGIQAAQERAAAASGGGYASRYNTGLFGGGNPSAGRVTVRK